MTRPPAPPKASTGEPCAYLALNFLHFVSFAPPARDRLLALNLLSTLLGLLRGSGGEYELRRAALSLLVSLAQVGRSGGGA